MESNTSHTVDREHAVSLLKSVRNGDQRAFELLLEQYNPLIESLVLKFFDEEVTGLNKDDLRQEAVLKFYNSIFSYDAEQSEVEFGLYAKICISNALVSQLRLHKKHTAEQLTESLNDMFFVHDSEDPSDKFFEEERAKALYSVIRSNLSDFEYRVWHYYMSGRSYGEIGDILNKDEKSIGNAIYRIRKKLRLALK